MLIIRLQRTGRKNQPYFRLVLIEHTRKVGGKYLESLGSRDPRSKVTTLKKERILHWLSKGVKTSPTVHNLLVSQKVIDGSKVQAWKPKKSKKDEVAAPAPEAKP
jgi:small subunit ribosomal protein S16